MDATIETPFQIKRDTTYRGFLISPVFSYDNGKSDFQIFESNTEHGTIYPYCTLADVKRDINEIREERPEQFRVITHTNRNWQMYNITKFTSFIDAVEFAVRVNGEIVNA